MDNVNNNNIVCFQEVLYPSYEQQNKIFKPLQNDLKSGIIFHSWKRVKMLRYRFIIYHE